MVDCVGARFAIDAASDVGRNGLSSSDDPPVTPLALDDLDYPSQTEDRHFTDLDGVTTKDELDREECPSQ